MKFDHASLQRLSAETGFRPQVLEKVLHLLDLLEGFRKHPFLQVTRHGVPHNYCDYLADYTKEFLEIVDAEFNSEDAHFEPHPLDVDDDSVDGIEISYEDDELVVTNETENMLLFKELLHDDRYIPIGAVLPVDFSARFRIGSDIAPHRIKVIIAAAGRVDMLVPRSHAIVRHGVSALDESELELPT